MTFQFESPGICSAGQVISGVSCQRSHYCLLTNWLAYLYGRIQSPRPDVMPDRREAVLTGLKAY